MQLVSKCISEEFGFSHSIQGGFLLRYTNFGPIDSFPSYEKKNVLRTMCLHFSRMLNIEHRAVIKFFTRKRLNTTKISKELDSVYKDSASSYRTVAKWVTEFKDPECGFEDAPRMGHPSTIITQENIEAVEWIVMRNRQVSVRGLAEELAIIHEIMDNHMGMKKICIWWVPKIVDTNSTCQSCGLLSKAPATERSKSSQVF